MRSRTSLRGFLLGGCAVALIAAPWNFDAGAPDLQVQSAVARDKGGGDRGGGQSGGRGGGQGQGRGEQGGSGADRSRGVSSEARQRGPQHERARGPGLAAAQARYEDALGRKRSPGRGAEAERKDTARAALLDRRATAALISLGWERPRTGTFRNHGQRVSTMVALAKELGYPASVGALQGNFGTPFENGVATAVAELEVARAALALAPLDPLLQAEVVRLEASLATATAGLPQGSFGEWATVDLDVTGDGVVDAADLAAARAGAASGSEPTEGTTPSVDTAAAAP